MARLGRGVPNRPILLRTLAEEPGEPPPEAPNPTTFTVGLPHGRWHAGPPNGRWTTGQPYSRWAVGPPGGS